MNSKQTKTVRASKSIPPFIVAIVSALVYGIIDWAILWIPYDYGNDLAYTAINCAATAVPIIMAIIFALTFKKLAGEGANVRNYRNHCVGFLLFGGIIISLFGFLSSFVSSAGCSGLNCLGGIAPLFYALLIAKPMIILGILYYVATIIPAQNNHFK